MDSPPFDRAAVLENLCGDKALFAEIARIFVTDWPRNRARLRAAVAAGDAAALRHAAHAVKGSAANFSADRAVQLARELEFAGRDGDLAHAAQLLESVVAAVEELAAALQREVI